MAGVFWLRDGLFFGARSCFETEVWLPGKVEGKNWSGFKWWRGRHWDMDVSGTVVRESICQCRTRVWSLVREHPMCHGATKPMSCSYWVPALGPACCSYWTRCCPAPDAHAPAASAAQREATIMRPRTAMKRSLCLLQLESLCTARKTHAI